MRVARFCLIAGAGAALAVPALAEQAYTTRIETQRYYGAVTTVEHGVRVTRPLPATQHMIINPEGATPLSLNVGGGASIASPPNAPEPEGEQQHSE
jgi:hypothetical protein